MTASPLISTLRVSSCEVDSFGHVNNAVYLQYCERVRNDYMLQCGLKFSDFAEWKAGPVVYRAEMDYRQPAIVDDELNVLGDMGTMGRTRFRIVHRFIRTRDKALVCQANLVFAFVALTDGRPCRIPARFLQAFGLA